MTVVDVQPHVS